jgi:FkbM family methyltransferase
VDKELRLWLWLSRRLPRRRGSVFVADTCAQLYRRKPRDAVSIDVLGARMVLDPHEYVDGQLLFYPQLKDRDEVAYMEDNLTEGCCFVDVGANIGFFSLLASRLVGDEGRVIAIEADPYSHSRLRSNLELNAATNVRALNVGVSDRRGTERLGINVTGNRGNSGFYSDSAHGADVPCLPLQEVLTRQGVNRVDGAKFDIEGHEFRVLSKFFAESTSALFPRFIVIEHTANIPSKARTRIGGDAVRLLRSKGYRVHFSNKDNHIMVL